MRVDLIGDCDFCDLTNAPLRLLGKGGEMAACEACPPVRREPLMVWPDEIPAPTEAECERLGM